MLSDFYFILILVNNCFMQCAFIFVIFGMMNAFFVILVLGIVDCLCFFLLFGDRDQSRHFGPFNVSTFHLRA